MESSEPVSIIAGITAAISAAAGIYSATQKPDEPEKPKTAQSPAAIAAQRQQRAAATGRQGTILTSQKLGQVGGS